MKKVIAVLDIILGILTIANAIKLLKSECKTKEIEL